MSAEIWGWWRVRLGSRCAMRYPVPLLFLNLLTLLQGTICAFPLLYSPFCSAPLHSGTGRRPERQTTCRMILVREIARNVVSYRVPGTGTVPCSPEFAETASRAFGSHFLCPESPSVCWLLLGCSITTDRQSPPPLLPSASTALLDSLQRWLCCHRCNSCL